MHVSHISSHSYIPYAISFYQVADIISPRDTTNAFIKTIQLLLT